MTLTVAEAKKVRLANLIEVIQAYLNGTPIQFRTINSNEPWQIVTDPSFNLGYADYRIRPATPDHVPWGAVSEDYDWYARDENGERWFYSTEPEKGGCSWKFPKEASINGGRPKFSTAGALDITVGECKWYDSLQKRPRTK